MNGLDSLFTRLWGGSILAHLLLFSALFLIPAGGPPLEPIMVYRVKLVDAPAQPPVRKLEISTDSISSLAPGPPGAETEVPPPGALAVPSAPEAPARPLPAAIAAPPLLPPPDRQSAPPALEGPPAPVEAAAARPLPSLPATSKPPPPPSPALGAGELPPTSAPAAAPRSDPAMEKLRKKVQSLQIRFEEPVVATGGPGIAPAPNRGFRLSLRIYQNQLQEEIKRRYTFPGSFDPNLRARVRLTITRDGKVAKTEILQSSGNEPFDLAVRLTLQRVKFPPIPETIEGETVTQVITFTPDNFSGRR